MKSRLAQENEELRKRLRETQALLRELIFMIENGGTWTLEHQERCRKVTEAE
jgi:hypothetical protein